MNDQAPIGFLLINKPAGITSRDCVNQLQRMLPPKTKIGHAGTLDKFATGLLIIGIGRPATRLFKYLMKFDKKYWVRAKLGEQTDTLDKTGDILTVCSEDQVSLERLQKVFDDFPGTYEQTPPKFSALKWHGKRLSDMARSPRWRDQKIERILETKTKTVHIYALNFLGYLPPFMTFDVHVSHGTYVRALAHDIAQKCDSVATTYDLTRIEVGNFKLSDAADLDEIEGVDDIERLLVPVEDIERIIADNLKKAA